MVYGNSIGNKFNADGSVRRFPGNTVVAPIQPGCSAYDTMVQLRQMVIDAGLEDHMILLPEDSYHMTVLDCVVDQQRVADRWPAGLALDAPMDEVDDYISAAVAKATNPGSVRMKFDRINISPTCVIALLTPADEEQKMKLWAFRDAATEAMGMRVPNYASYRFHISLAYVRTIPEGASAQRLEELKTQIDALLSQQPAFETGIPYMAYFDDMLSFSPDRIPRC